jgi:endo-1,4-beta-xylanase
MSQAHQLSRRSLLLGAAGLAAAGVVGAAVPAAGGTATATGSGGRTPLYRLARRRGIAYGTSAATWQLEDAEYAALVAREAAILFTEDDLLWYRLKPTPDSPLDFSFGDRIVGFAERHGMLVFGAHLVWDEGFGEGWTEDDLWGLERAEARRLLFGTVRAVVRHYRGRVDVWSVANEVTSPEGVRGIRTDVPWYETIGPSYIPESFFIAHELDPKALLVLNEFGFETVNEFGDRPGPRRRATLQVIDWLLGKGVPVHALGIQAHLLADRFAERFHAAAYRRFLDEVADRGLKILITELDVLDDGLPANIAVRDRGVADVYRRYLDVALDHPAVKALITFGLSDRYTWLQEDLPREDGAARRPLPFDEDLQPKPAYYALAHSLRDAPWRRPLWPIRR